MRRKVLIRHPEVFLWKYSFIFSFFVIALVFPLCATSMAIDMDVGGKPLRLMGYIKQGAGYGIGGDEWDTKEGFQSFYYDLLLETEYKPSPGVRLFVSGMLSGDWAYDILNDSDEWVRKGFAESRGALSHDTVFRDLLQECHVTYSPGNFFFRFGKQIVVWGEMDGTRVMDQINPLDQRRGLTDVEFEVTVVPIWLANMAYYPSIDVGWLQELGFEFVFNPNADFVPNRGPFTPGKELHGIWAPNIVPFPGAHMGSFITSIEEPDDWDSEWFEYAFRIRMVVKDAIITLNYFDGVRDTPALINVGPPVIGVDPYDGSLIVHLPMAGFYPDLKFAGATFARDFQSLRSTALGGVAPVVRLEAMYMWDNEMTVNVPPPQPQRLEKYDEVRWGIGVDWKVKIPFLNPRAYFMVGPQIIHRSISDFPDVGLLDSATPIRRDDNWESALLINTTYFNTKLKPQFIWLRNITDRSNVYFPQIGYEYDHHWDFTLGAFFIHGKLPGFGLHPFNNKDHIFFNVRYRF